MICKVFIQGEYGTLVVFRVFEVDQDVFLVHTKNKKDFYGNFTEEEFYMTKKNAVWISEPEQSPELLKEIGKEIDQAMKRKNHSSH